MSDFMGGLVGTRSFWRRQYTLCGYELVKLTIRRREEEEEAIKEEEKEEARRGE